MKHKHIYTYLEIIWVRFKSGKYCKHMHLLVFISTSSLMLFSVSCPCTRYTHHTREVSQLTRVENMPTKRLFLFSLFSFSLTFTLPRVLKTHFFTTLFFCLYTCTPISVMSRIRHGSFLKRDNRKKAYLKFHLKTES